jgi:tetratricopeptide (TPR) repeat protein
LIKAVTPWLALWLLVLAAGSAWAAPASAPLVSQPQRIQRLSDQINASPADPALYLRRALIYADLGEFKRALVDIDKAAQFGPPEETYLVRGMVLYRLGQFSQALPWLNRYLDRHPKHAGALHYRARLLREQHQPEAALRDYQRYLAEVAQPSPGDVLVTAQLMVLLADQGHKQYPRAKAVAFLDERIQKFSTHQSADQAGTQSGNAAELVRYALEIEEQSCHSQAVLQRLHSLPASSRQAVAWHLQVAEQHLLLQQAPAAQTALTTAQQVLQQHRPSPARAEQAARYAVLQGVLASKTLPQDRSLPALQAFYRCWRR